MWLLRGEHMLRHWVVSANKGLYINRGYWAEKLVATDSNGRHSSGCEEYDPDKFRRAIYSEALRLCREAVAIVDIGLRMLTPRELARAQGFPDDYILDRGWFVDAKSPTGEWRPTTKTDQVRLIGNSVCPPVAAAIARANLADLVKTYCTEAA